MSFLSGFFALLGLPLCGATLYLFKTLSVNFAEVVRTQCFPSASKLTGTHQIDSALCAFNSFYSEVMKHPVNVPVLLLVLPLAFAFTILASMESLRPRSFGLVVIYPLWSLLTNFVGVGVTMPLWIVGFVLFSRSTSSSPHRSPMFIYAAFIAHLPLVVPYIGMFFFSNTRERELGTAAYVIGSISVALFVFLLRLIFSFFKSTSKYGAKAATGIWLLIAGAGLILHLIFLVRIVDNNLELFHALLQLPYSHSGGLELVYMLLVDFLALQAAFFLFVLIDEGLSSAIVSLIIGLCLGPTTSASLYLAARELSIYETYFSKQTQLEKKQK